MIISLMFNICLADTETVGKNEVSKVSEVAPESTETSESVDQEKQDKFQELVQLAKDKLIEKDYKSADKLLLEAKESMEDVERILSVNEISSVWFYLGISQQLQGNDPLHYWRQTLILNLGQAWDIELLNDESSYDAFLALKSEVQNRKIVSLQVPELYGQSKIYVDGFLRAPADFAYQGEHFAQIECPKGDIHSKWTTFEKKVKWIKMCPYKFDVTDVPQEEAVDEWDMFGGSFGNTD